MPAIGRWVSYLSSQWSGDSIDITTQPGAQCRDLWTGTGHDLRINIRGSNGFDGLRTSGANQTIRGLPLSGFNNAIVTQATSSNTAVLCIYLGLLANGISNNNAGRGVEVFGAGVRIGFNRTLGALLLNGTNNAAIQLFTRQHHQCADWRGRFDGGQ